MDYKLSILIPSLKKREESLIKTVKNLHSQMMDVYGSFSDIEILIDADNGERPTGEKRNRLIDRATGKYIVFFDDDDEPLDGYIRLIMEAIKHNPDVIPVNGFMTTNGTNPVYWDMGLGFGYGTKMVGGQMVYDRFPNHIAVMKRELIKEFKFLPIVRGEDYDWAKRIHDAKVLKTEYRITMPIYHYCFIENK